MARPAVQDKSLIGLAGEYHVLAQLAERGIVGALTLGHTKGIDILLTNPRTGTVRRVEVKTTRAKPSKASLFGPNPFFSWTMSAKHETVAARDLIYCFVYLAGAGMAPHIFVVPSRIVARYVRWEHQHWLRSRPRKPGYDNNMRRFRIEEHDPSGYANNWRLFE